MSNPINSNFIIKHATFFGNFCVIGYLTSVFYAEIFDHKNLRWSPGQYLSPITSHFSFNDYSRWFWLSFTTLNAVSMVHATTPVNDYFTTIIKTTAKKYYSDLKTNQSENQKEQILLRYLKIGKICLVFQSIGLSSLVIFVQGNANTAPKMTGNSNMSNTVMNVHYSITLVYTLTIITEFYYFGKIFNYLRKVDAIFGTNYSEIHKIGVQKFLQYGFAVSLVIDLSAFDLGWVFRAVESINKYEELVWDIWVFFEIVWILFIVLFHRGFFMGVDRGIRFYNQQVCFVEQKNEDEKDELI